MSSKSILFVSNGLGEDTVSASIIKAMKDRKGDYNLIAFPLVGRGDVFEKLPVEIIGPRSNMPSGGLINNNLSAILNDIKSGLPGLTIQQIKILKNSFHKYNLIVAIGDRFPLLLSAIFTPLPIVFIGIAQSVKVHGYSALERWFIKRRTRVIFTRDFETAKNLQYYGIKAIFEGNPMMDTFSITGNRGNLPEDAVVLSMLPGSRSEIYCNFKKCLMVSQRLYSMSSSIIFFMALSPQFNWEEIAHKILPDGWSWTHSNIEGFIILKNIDGTQIELTQDYFGWVLNQSSVVLGLAGTGNEQAAGLGKPVVSFWSEERQVRPAFIKHQKQLLGDALIISESDLEVLSLKIFELLFKPEVAKKIGQAGKEMMGQRGATEKIVNYIEYCLSNP